MYRSNILNLGSIELQQTMPHGAAPLMDRAVVAAARTSYLGECVDEEKDKKLLYYLIDNGHWSPFEMVEWQFKVKAPVVVWWQWVRHRTWSYNFQSGRYTEFKDELYIPDFDGWRYPDSKDKQASAGSLPEYRGEHLSKKLRTLWDESYEMYHEFLKMGVAREQARLVLPAWGLYYTAIAKVDTRNLIHFLKLRRTDHAQWEIRQYAAAIEKMLAELMPWTYEKVFGHDSSV